MNYEKITNSIMVVLIVFCAGFLVYMNQIENVSSEDIAGIDTDKDGIRDDMQAFINQKYPPPSDLNKVLLEYARLFQLQIVDANDEQLSRKHNADENFVSDCLWEMKGEEIISIKDEIQEIMLNTNARRVAYRKFDSHLGGMWSENDGKKACNDILSRKTINTNNWNTYTNTTFGFRFKYPRDYTVKETTYYNSNEFAVEIKSPQSDAIAEGTAGEMTDAIYIVPKHPEPSSVSEKSFDNEFDHYLGRVFVDGREGYVWWGDEIQRKFVEFNNNDKTGFLIDGGLFNFGKDTRGLNPPSTAQTQIEPYDTIVYSLEFYK